MFASAVVLVPYFHAKLIKEDHRLHSWHIPLGHRLWKNSYSLYCPRFCRFTETTDYCVTDYIGSDSSVSEFSKEKTNTVEHSMVKGADDGNEVDPVSRGGNTADVGNRAQAATDKKRHKDLEVVDKFPWAHPRGILAHMKLVATYSLTCDVIGHQSRGLEEIHRRAPVYGNKVEHLWTTVQVCSARIMSISHGANDVSNLSTTEYMTWRSGETSAETGTPTWIKAVSGLTLGVGFVTFDCHIMRNLGNRITKHSSTRGCAMEFGAAIKVFPASKFGLSVSATQCITGAVVGVAMVNFDLKSINWKQLGKISLDDA